jgi:N-acetylmuramoyl-L-alanine amidase
VKLTRDRDVFIALRDRVGIARAAHGDLFVSLHADSNNHREAKGASVYTLSPGASDRETEDLADKENHSGAEFGLETSDSNPVANAILMDLGQREIMNLAARFAETIVATLPVATTIHSPSPHRSADFAVLKAPDIPSVLVELGYLTNPDDEREMETTTWRKRVAVAVAAAIDRHFSRALALQPASAQPKPLPLSGHIPGVRTRINLPSRAQE